MNMEIIILFTCTEKAWSIMRLLISSRSETRENIGASPALFLRW